MEPFGLPRVQSDVENAHIRCHLADQDGVISAQQARGCGLSASAIRRRVTSGAWSTVFAGVYRSTEHPLTARARLRATVLAAGPGACAWGPSAAWWRGMIDREPASTWVTVPRHRNVRRDGIGNIRRRTLAARDIDTVAGLHVTSRALTVLEASVMVTGGSALMDRAIQQGLSLRTLISVHRYNAGREGPAACAVLLRGAGEGGASEAERVVLRLLRGAGLTGWRTHVRSCGYEIDVGFEAERVAIEVDGWAWHRDAARFHSDAVRQNTLVNAGWHVLRFTWHRLTGDPAGVLAEIEAALARARPHVGENDR